jgi:hypothetical protein
MQSHITKVQTRTVGLQLSWHYDRQATGVFQKAGVDPKQRYFLFNELKKQKKEPGFPSTSEGTVR